MDDMTIYERTVARMKRMGIRGATEIIVTLAGECDGYRDRIKEMMTKHSIPGRRCEVDGKTGCWFHRFIEEDEVLLKANAFMRKEVLDMGASHILKKGITDPTFTVEKIRKVHALVEFPDGSLGRVKPELVTFLDREEW